MTAKSLASSEKLKIFVLVFSISATMLYLLCLLLGLATFTFHPATGRLEWGQTMPRRNEGPVMYWYGWVVTTLIGSAVLGFLATLLPERVINKIPLAAAWLLAVLAVPIFVYTLMPFWTK